MTYRLKSITIEKNHITNTVKTAMQNKLPCKNIAVVVAVQKL